MRQSLIAIMHEGAGRLRSLDVIRADFAIDGADWIAVSISRCSEDD